MSEMFEKAKSLRSASAKHLAATSASTPAKMATASVIIVTNNTCENTMNNTSVDSVSNTDPITNPEEMATAATENEAMKITIPDPNVMTTQEDKIDPITANTSNGSEHIHATESPDSNLGPEGSELHKLTEKGPNDYSDKDHTKNKEDTTDFPDETDDDLPSLRRQMIKMGSTLDAINNNLTSLTDSYHNLEAANSELKVDFTNFRTTITGDIELTKTSFNE
jgi:hypothetical protein